MIGHPSEFECNECACILLLKFGALANNIDMTHSVQTKD